MQTKSVKSVSLPDTLWNDLAAPAPVHTRKAESTLIAA
jgi:hypothetical protein